MSTCHAPVCDCSLTHARVTRCVRDTRESGEEREREGRVSEGGRKEGKSSDKADKKERASEGKCEREREKGKRGDEEQKTR